MIEQIQRVITSIVERVGTQGAVKESLGTVPASYNEMSEKSFGRFAERWYFRWLPMATQYMWWNWKMDFTFNKKGHYYDIPEVANRW